MTLGESKSALVVRAARRRHTQQQQLRRPVLLLRRDGCRGVGRRRLSGYAYFFSWKGQAYFTSADTSGAPDLSILVAGLTDIKTPSSSLEKGEVDFMADEMIAGSSRSTQAGDLVFTVTVEHAESSAWLDGTMFDMGSLAVRVDVDPVE